MRVILQEEVEIMRTLAFIFGLCIGTVGAVGALAPSALVWLAQHFRSSSAFYVLALIRIAFGLLLIRVASSSHAPKALRVLGYVIVILGVTTALMGLMAVDQARDMLEGWAQQRSVFQRLTSIPVLALGGFVAYACAPARRAAENQA